MEERKRGGCVIGDGVYCYDRYFSEWVVFRMEAREECQDSLPSPAENTCGAVEPLARDGSIECGVEGRWTAITMTDRP